MSETSVQIADLFRIRSRFLRSAHLERDFEDASALNGYVLTPHTASHLRRLTSGLAARSSQRAWRITGDYGVGKSSFALLLAHVLSGRKQAISNLATGAPTDLPSARERLVPILVTGSREPAAIAIVRALSVAGEKIRARGRRPRIFERLDKLSSRLKTGQASDADAVAAIQEVATAVHASGHGRGVLLILDELGKFLEFAAANPHRQDVYFLQQLAEAAARSGGTPLVVVGLLHQGFSAYADRLSESAQREWQKVAGRFEELVFDRPLPETALLIGDALNLDSKQVSRDISLRATEEMRATVRMGWYGPRQVEDELSQAAPSLYPLHPTVVPVLAKLLSRFGQHDRSLFSFLLSSEFSGLQAFANSAASADRFYRICDLYDYARASFGARLSVQSYRSHWNLIESVVESFPAEQEIESQLLKTVAMLNLLDDQGLLASPESIVLALRRGNNDDEIRDALAKLQKKRVLYLRGASGGFCLWPYTSVNIERAYSEAYKAIADVRSVSDVIASEVDSRPIVARRHYIETGNLRHFTVRCIAPDDLPAALKEPFDPSADGAILVPLCETEDQRQTALRLATNVEINRRPEVLVAVPKPLEMLRSMVVEAERWTWVANNTPELVHDRYAAEEVSRQLTAAKEVLRNRIQDLVGMRGTGGRTELQWYRLGKPVKIANGRALLSVLSETCDSVYSAAPKVRNELINRRQLSSAAAAARMRLIERVLASPSEALLGLNPTKKPPEMSMYLSVLQRGKLHVRRKAGFLLVEPQSNADPLNVRPAFDQFRTLLKAVPDSRIPVSRLFAELAAPPFGIREGLLPLLLAIFAMANEADVAFYEDNKFLPQLDGGAFMRLVKEPTSFEMQYCRVAGVRASVFLELARLLELDASQKTNRSRILDVVRPLSRFAAQLPRFTRLTRQLSSEATAVRSALLTAREPLGLLFRDLPTACSVAPFADQPVDGTPRIHKFVVTLKKALDELRDRYPRLLDDSRLHLRRTFAHSGTMSVLRSQLAHTSALLVRRVNDARLRGFCARLADQALPETEWLEALGTYVMSARMQDWTDGEAERFPHELDNIVALFRRVEATAFECQAVAGSFAARLSVTQDDGSDVARIVHLSADDEALATEFERRIWAVISESPRIGLAATSRVLLRELAAPSVRENRPVRPPH